MAIEAARAALAGLRLDEIVAKVKRMVPVTHMIQTADTLKYLYMGGRIGKATNLVGQLLNIKPLIGMEDGEIVPLGVARGRGHAYQAIADKVEETSEKAGPGSLTFTPGRNRKSKGSSKSWKTKWRWLNFSSANSHLPWRSIAGQARLDCVFCRRYK